MAEITTVKTLCDTVITIKDGTSPTALSYTVTLEPGNLTFTPLRAQYTDIIDRCEIVGSRKSGVEKGSLSFSLSFRQFTGSTDGSIIDLIEGTSGSAYAARTTTSTDYEGNVLEVVVTIEGTDRGDSADHVATFNKVRLWYDFAEGQPDVLNITGEILEAPTYTGGTGTAP